MRSTRVRLAGFAIAAALVAVAITIGACAPLPRQAFAGVRLADYVASQRELPPDIVRAMEAGHIVLGMDTKQVWVVLGDPARKTRFDRTATDVWLYRGGRLHQDHYRLGAQDVRLIFVKDRLIAIDML